MSLCSTVAKVRFLTRTCMCLFRSFTYVGSSTGHSDARGPVSLDAYWDREVARKVFMSPGRFKRDWNKYDYQVLCSISVKVRIVTRLRILVIYRLRRYIWQCPSWVEQGAEASS